MATVVEHLAAQKNQILTFFVVFFLLALASYCSLLIWLAAENVNLLSGACQDGHYLTIAQNSSTPVDSGHKKVINRLTWCVNRSHNGLLQYVYFGELVQPEIPFILAY